MEGHKYVLVRARIHSPCMAVVHARATGFNGGHVTFTRAQVGLLIIYNTYDNYIGDMLLTE